MEQPEQVLNPTCNTNIKRSGGKCRNWCFTLNNYTVEDIKVICGFDCKYVFQEEIGDLGTKHLQGLLMFKSPRSFNSIKKLIPRAHWEPTKSKNASIRYCSKAETRAGEIYSNLADRSLFGTNGTTILGKNFDELLGENIIKNRDFLTADEALAISVGYSPWDFWVCARGCIGNCNCEC